MRRTLSLARETLTELTGDELSLMPGAANGATLLTCPLAECLDLSGDLSCYPSCGHSGCCSIDAC